MNTKNNNDSLRYFAPDSADDSERQHGEGGRLFKMPGVLLLFVSQAVTNINEESEWSQLSIWLQHTVSDHF